jgi:hypothetical protein
MTENIINKPNFKSFVTANSINSSHGIIVVAAYPTRHHNYAWCEYCTGKYKIIRFQFFEVFHIIHENSFFHWRKQIIRTRWLAFNEDSGTRHKQDVTAAVPPSSPPLQQQNLTAENNMEVAAKAKTSRLLCNCPGAEPGKIKIDVSAHLFGCWIRKRLLTLRYTIDASVTPDKFNDGYSLGVALTN